jgi:hypothetical protein
MNVWLVAAGVVASPTWASDEATGHALPSEHGSDGALNGGQTGQRQ